MINWKIKAAAYHIFDKVPFGNFLYLQTQKRVTKSVPRTHSSYISSRGLIQEHVNNFNINFGNISDASYFEFGAGWDLLNNLLLYSFGLNNQLVIDRTMLARPHFINAAIKKIIENPISDFVRTPERFVTKNFVQELEEYYGIKYLAPADATQIPVADGSIDLIATTSTLEHIPEADLKNIIKECYRVCNERSVLSMQISYNDHYAHSDRSITPYNYYQYSKKHWSLYNPSTHYQNRLRAPDFRKLFIEAGFNILNETAKAPANAEDLISQVSIHKDFESYSREDLLKTYGNLVCKKK